MPDPQQAADVVATVGKGSAAALGLVAAARVLVSLAKKLGLSEDLAAQQARDREQLQAEHREERARWKAETEELRTRLAEVEDAVRRGDLESIAWQQRYAALESECERLRATWDSERTLPPGLG